MKIRIEGVDKSVTVDDSFKDWAPAEQDALAEEIRGSYAKGIKSSLGAEAPPVATASQPQFDAMGNPTGATTDVPVDAPSMPYGEQMKNAGSAIDSGMRVIANGASFDFADKAAAAMRTLTGDAPDYQTAIQQERERTDAVGAATPGANTALKATGAAMTGAGLLRGGLSLGAQALERGAPLLARAVGFGADAGVAGGLQGAGSTDNGSAANYANNIGRGVTEGAALGTALPIAGSAIGGAYRAVSPLLSRPPAGLSRPTAALLNAALPDDAAATLAALGPAGLPADVSPSMQGLTQGVVAKDRSGNSLVGLLKSRAQATPTRLNADLEANIGPDISTQQLNQAMTDRMAENGPAYTAAKTNAPPVDTTNTVAKIGELLNSEPQGTPERSKLLQIRDMLRPKNDDGVPVPVTDAATLHKVRRFIDTTQNYGDPAAGLAPGAASAEGNVFTPVRSALSNDLHTQVPGFAEADLAHSTAAEGLNSIKRGTAALKGGDDAIHPVDLATQFNAAPLEQQALERAAASADIRRKVGTTPFDLSAHRRIFGDTEDWNRAKAGLLFGQQPTNNMLSAIERENTFANTANPAITGSRTGPLTENSRAIDAAGEPYKAIIPTNVTTLGLLGHSLEWAGRKGLGLLGENTGNMVRSQIANVMAMPPGPQRDTLLQAIEQARAGQANAGQAVSGLLNNPLLARGLLAVRANQSSTR